MKLNITNIQTFTNVFPSFTYSNILPIIIVFGIVGNVLILVTSHYNPTKSNGFIYIWYLAISDLGACILISFWPVIHILATQFNWPFAVTFGWNAFLIYFVNVAINVFMKASTLITCSLTLDRYVALHKPLEYRKFSVPRMINMAVIASFLISFLLMCPRILQYKIVGDTPSLAYTTTTSIDIPPSFVLTTKQNDNDIIYNNFSLTSNLTRRHMVGNWRKKLGKKIKATNSTDNTNKFNQPTIPYSMYQNEPFAQDKTVIFRSLQNLSPYFDAPNYLSTSFAFKSPLIGKRKRDTALSYKNTNFERNLSEFEKLPIHKNFSRNRPNTSNTKIYPLFTKLKLVQTGNGSHFITENAPLDERISYHFVPNENFSKLVSYKIYQWLREIILTFLPLLLLTLMNFSIIRQYKINMQKRASIMNYKKTDSPNKNTKAKKIKASSDSAKLQNGHENSTNYVILEENKNPPFKFAFQKFVKVNFVPAKYLHHKVDRASPASKSSIEHVKKQSFFKSLSKRLDRKRSSTREYSDFENGGITDLDEESIPLSTTPKKELLIMTQQNQGRDNMKSNILRPILKITKSSPSKISNNILMQDSNEEIANITDHKNQNQSPAPSRQILITMDSEPFMEEVSSDQPCSGRITFSHDNDTYSSSLDNSMATGSYLNNNCLENSANGFYNGDNLTRNNNLISKNNDDGKHIYTTSASVSPTKNNKKESNDDENHCNKNQIIHHDKLELTVNREDMKNTKDKKKDKFMVKKISRKLSLIPTSQNAVLLVKNEKARKHAKDEKRLTIMLLTIVSLHFVCNIPQALVTIIESKYHPPNVNQTTSITTTSANGHNTQNIHELGFYIIQIALTATNVLETLNFALNFYLYCVFIKDFRLQVKTLCQRLWANCDIKCFK